MADTLNAGVRIGQLTLRIPEDSAENVHHVADSITKRLAQKFPAGMQRHHRALSVRVQLRGCGSEAEKTDVIAKAIIKALGRGIPGDGCKKLTSNGERTYGLCPFIKT